MLNSLKRKIVSLTTLAAVLVAVPCQALAMDNKKAAEPNAEIKNTIVLIADGMSVDGVALTRWYNSYDEKSGKVDPSKQLSLDSMASGLVRTYWQTDEVVGAITDSAPGGTAFSTGQKTNDKFIAVTPKKIPLATIAEAAKAKDKSVGIISTSQIMHATPADYSSHYPDRSQEEIIAEQQVYNNFDVMLGGGWGRLSNRKDKEDLVAVLKEKGYSYVTNKKELDAASGKIWGMFAESAMAYEMDRQTVKPEEPSLQEMTGKAIQELAKDKDGFFLMVEGSKVDWAAHANDPVGVVSDINAFDKAVAVALDFAKKDKQTMVIAITDHGNGGLTIGNAETTETYSKDPVEKFIAPLKKAKLTGEGLEAKLSENKADIKKTMNDFYGITDLTAEEEKAIQTAEKGMMNYVVGPMISKRAFLGWTTNGHTGEDIVLYTYLPGDERITGTIENTDIAKICSGVWDIDLAAVTSDMYIDAKSAFEKQGATVKVDSSDAENPKMVVTKGKDTISIPENKDYVEFNGEKVEVNSVNVNIEGQFYVSSSALELIK